LIYFMQPTEGGPVKIGYSCDVESRRRQLEKAYGQELVILATMEGDSDEEQELHARFAHLRLKGHKSRGAAPEQFRPDSELMDFIGRPFLATANPDTIEAMKSRISTITIRAGEDWTVWLDGLCEAMARDAGMPTPDRTAIIDHALTRLASERGYKAPPARY
jgi:hypothetical protein